jgi:hypothetical protein
VFDYKQSTTRRVILVSFKGQLSAKDFADLDAMGRDRKDGPSYDCIFDMTDVGKIDLATEFVAKRGELPQVFSDRQRIYVVPQDDLKLLVKLYAAYQVSQGWQPPILVDRLGEAFGMLGVSEADFAA